MVREQLTRAPTTLPELYIDREVSTIDDIMALDWADIRLEGYNPMPDIQNKPKMAV